MIRKIARAVVPERWHLSRMLRDEIVRRADGVVVSGLFAGMRYVHQSSGSVWLPKLLGTYERELCGSLNAMLNESFDSIVVAGAAEGYYAVGFALRSRARQIFAFEPNPRARELLGEMADMNGVADRIEVGNICDLSQLRRCLSGRANSMLFVDIEGGEALLLDPNMLPELRRATVVVEVHEQALAGVGALLCGRFADSHTVLRIATESRRAEDAPTINGVQIWTERQRGALEQLLCEMRGGDMTWLVMTPKPHK